MYSVGVVLTRCIKDIGSAVDGLENRERQVYYVFLHSIDTLKLALSIQFATGLLFFKVAIESSCWMDRWMDGIKEGRKEGWMIRVDGQDRTVGWQIRETSDEAGSDRISQGIKPLKMFCFETAEQHCPAAHFVWI